MKIIRKLLCLLLTHTSLIKTVSRVTFIAEFQAVSHGILTLFGERVNYTPVVFTF